MGGAHPNAVILATVSLGDASSYPSDERDAKESFSLTDINEFHVLGFHESERRRYVLQFVMLETNLLPILEPPKGEEKKNEIVSTKKIPFTVRAIFPREFREDDRGRSRLGNLSTDLRRATDFCP